MYGPMYDPMYDPVHGHDLGWEPGPGNTAHGPADGPAHDPDDVENCVTELRDALAAHGITLPSIGVELPAFAATPRLPLVALGNCNVDTARRLSAVLRTAWRVEERS